MFLFVKAFVLSFLSRFGEDSYVSWSTYIDESTVTTTPTKTAKPSISSVEYIPTSSTSIDHQENLKNLTFKDLLKHVKDKITDTANNKKTDGTDTSDDDIKQKYWVQLELARAREEILSFHGDVDGCEDTERVVLLDDFSFVLFSLGNEEGVFQMFLSYLLLFGLPVPKSRYSKSLLKLTTKFTKVIEATNQYLSFYHTAELNCDFVQIADSTLFSSSGIGGGYKLTLVRRILSHAMEIFEAPSILQCLSVIWFHMESTLFRRSFEDVNNELDKKYWKEMRR